MEKEYDGLKAYLYAKRWAFGRNPAYFNFDRLGGDCTNFISQCLFAGSGVMNYTPIFGWFYKNADDRTASWTGVEYLFRFLTENTGPGPFARPTDQSKLKIGDVIQLGRDNDDFYHSLLVCGFRRGYPLVAAHSMDSFLRPLYTYSYEKARFLHIVGVRLPDQPR